MRTMGCAAENMWLKGDVMKYNLNSRPRPQKHTSREVDLFIEWCASFEKELRKALEFEEEQAKKSDIDLRLVAHFRIDLLKEILGE